MCYCFETELLPTFTNTHVSKFGHVLVESKCPIPNGACADDPTQTAVLLRTFCCCLDGYLVSGSSIQPSINGVYSRASKTANGHSYYTKGSGTATRVLYWAPTSGGKWCVGDVVGKGYRAVAEDGSSPTFGPPRSSGWKAYQNKWVQESSITVSTQGAQSTHPCTHFFGKSFHH